MVLAGWPCLKTIIVGIDMTPYCAAVCWFSSTLSLTMRRSWRSRRSPRARGDDAARDRTRGPEVDEDRLLGLEHLGGEVRVGDVLEVGHATHYTK
jgi:hypothetical protein